MTLIWCQRRFIHLNEVQWMNLRCKRKFIRGTQSRATAAEKKESQWESRRVKERQRSKEREKQCYQLAIHVTRKQTLSIAQSVPLYTLFYAIIVTLSYHSAITCPAVAQSPLAPS
jgi:hypothetical protein